MGEVSEEVSNKQVKKKGKKKKKKKKKKAQLPSNDQKSSCGQLWEVSEDRDGDADGLIGVCQRQHGKERNDEKQEKWSEREREVGVFMRACTKKVPWWR